MQLLCDFPAQFQQLRINGSQRKTSKVKHKFDVGEATSIKQTPRSNTSSERKVTVQWDGKEWGVIKPYSSPVDLAKKEDGSSRFCNGYRRLNKRTKRADTLPTTENKQNSSSHWTHKVAGKYCREISR